MCKRGDIYIVNLPESKGSVQKGKRPFLIIQNDIGNKYSPTVIGVVLTSNTYKKDMPTHVKISSEVGLISDSVALCEQVFTVDKLALEKRVCSVTDDIMEQVSNAVKVSVGVNSKPDETIINDMISIIRNKKASGKTIMNMFTRYCNSFGIDYKEYASELKLA